MMHVFRFRVFAQPNHGEFAHGWIRAGSLAEARTIIGHRHVAFDIAETLPLSPHGEVPAVIWIWSVEGEAGPPQEEELALSAEAGSRAA